MEFPIINRQVSARLTAEELEFLNELISKLYVDQDMADPSVTLRSVFMRIAEVADSKLMKANHSKPEDLEKIKKLEKDGQDIYELYKQKCIENQDEIDKHQSEVEEILLKIKQLSERNEELETELSGISSEKNEVSEKVRNLEKYVPVPHEMRIVVDPITFALLSLYAEKISRLSKKDITAAEILPKFFTQYITKRLTMFPGYPFLISDQEIIEVSKQAENE